MAKRPRMRPIRALLWEQWRQTRWFLLTPLVIGLIGTAAVFLASRLAPPHQLGSRSISPLDTPWLQFAYGWVVVAWQAYFTVLLTVSFSGSSSTKERLAGPPKHFHTLPVKSSMAAAVHQAYRATTLALLGIVLLGLLRVTPHLPQGAFEETTCILVLAGLLYLLAQALSWTLGNIHFGLAALAFVLLMPLSLLALGKPSNLFYRIRGEFLLPAVAVTIACLTIAVAGSVLDRRGFWATLRDLRPSLSIPSLRRRPRRFGCDLHAQYWFHRSRLHYILPAITAFCVTVSLVTLLSTLKVYQENTLMDNERTIPAVMALAASIVVPGTLASLSYYANTMSSFVLTHAVSTRSLVIFRLLTALRTALTAYALVFAAFAGYLALTGKTLQTLVTMGSLVNQEQPALALLHVALLGHFAITWALLSFPSPVILTSLSILVLFIPAQFFRIEFVPFLSAILALASAIMALLIFRDHRQRKRDGSPMFGSAKPLLLAAAMVVAVWTLLYHVFEMRLRDSHTAEDYALWLTTSVFFSFVCVAPLTLMPSCVRSYRHDGVALLRIQVKQDD